MNVIVKAFYNCYCIIRMNLCNATTCSAKFEGGKV